MGKWTEIVRGLKEVPLEEEKRIERERIKTQLTEAIIETRKKQNKEGDPTTADFVAKYELLRDLEDEASDELKEIAAHIEALRSILVERYEKEGIQKLTLDDGTNVAIEVEPYAGVEDKAAFMEYVRADEDLTLALTLPWPTLNSMVKELLQSGKELPPGVKVFLKNKAVLRRAK